MPLSSLPALVEKWKQRPAIVILPSPLGIEEMEDRNVLEFDAIILAAGSSSRMGQSKQLLDICGEPLLRRTVRTVLDAKPNNVVVILGANRESHAQVIKDLPVRIINNSSWQNGMGSSIKVGLRYLLEISPSSPAVIILVCDQPKLTSAVLNEMKDAFKRSNALLIANEYNGTLGVPAMFDKSLFDSLLNLPDNQGAKMIIQENLSVAETLSFPEGAIDLDTPEDYLKFKDEKI
ncbi:MAG TPA: nucleotidyltransferase family protein [Cyclobacteriaceae bacterium]|nr:nucleotidyltransferase family protein [Cyclobacteriaceae bacterium]